MILLLVLCYICPDHCLSINRECCISYDDLKGCPIATSFSFIYSYAYLDISLLEY